MPEKSEDSASGEAEMADSRGLVTRLLLTIAIFPCILRLFWQRSLAQAAARFGRRAARASPKRLELRSMTVPCGKSARVLLATVPRYLASSNAWSSVGREPAQKTKQGHRPALDCSSFYTGRLRCFFLWSGCDLIAPPVFSSLRPGPPRPTNSNVTLSSRCRPP